MRACLPRTFFVIIIANSCKAEDPKRRCAHLRRSEEVMMTERRRREEGAGGREDGRTDASPLSPRLSHIGQRDREFAIDIA